MYNDIHKSGNKDVMIDWVIADVLMCDDGQACGNDSCDSLCFVRLKVGHLE